MSGWFDEIGDATVQKTGTWLHPGKYRVKLKAVKKVKGQKGDNFLVIEMDVLASNNPEIQVGVEKSQVIKMGGPMSLPNIKGFIAAVSGVDPTLDNVNDLIEEYWFKNNPQGVRLPLSRIVDELVVQYNALEGVVMNLECVSITTQSGNPFTKHIWEVRQD
ncbi:MAG: hypothetical protein ACE5F6_00105 [Anaerolineae bacterium]